MDILVEYKPLTRERAIQDGAEIVSLGSDQPWEYWTVENLLAERPDKWFFSLLAEVEGKVVGYAVASRQGNVVHLHHLIVSPLFRGLGVGRKLLCRLALRLQEAGVDKLTLKVYRDNHRSIEFYHGFSFVVVDEKSTDEQLLMTASAGDVLNKFATAAH
jgi:ribosomal protein S18 acetylase RimI-like enzyme